MSGNVLALEVVLDLLVVEAAVPLHALLLARMLPLVVHLLQQLVQLQPVKSRLPQLPPQGRLLDAPQQLQAWLALSRLRPAVRLMKRQANISHSLQEFLSLACHQLRQRRLLFLVAGVREGSQPRVGKLGVVDNSRVIETGIVHHRASFV